MFSRRKLTVMATMALVTTTLLAGCSSTSSKGGEVTSAEVLANKNARAAISMAIDKQGFCDVILNNGSIPADQFTPPTLAFDKEGNDYTELTKGMGYTYDEEKAKELWAKAKEEVGFENVTIELATYDHDLGKKSGEFIQGELSDCLEGLTVNVVNLPFKQKLDKETKGDFDLAFSGWGADYPDPLTFLSTMETGNQFAKQVGYNSEEFNKLVNEAKTLPAADAYKKYAEAEKLMLEDGFIAPLYFKGRTYLEKPYVSGIVRYSWGPEYSYLDADVDKPEKVLNRDESASLPTMDPSKSTDTVSFTTMNNTMEGLTRVDKDGKVEPGVAEKWSVSEDGLTWTFNLRKDSKWSNGTPVTAKDFEYSWKRTLNPETASEYGYIMYDVAGAEDYNLAKATDASTVGVKAVDDYTLQVTLNRPVVYFPELMSFQVFFPQNQAFVEEMGDKYGLSTDAQIYNGPFTLSSWKTEDQYTMTKNPGYWNKDRIKLETINTKIVKEIGTSVNLYESGDIDTCLLDSEYIDKYKDNKEMHKYVQASTFMLQVNGGRETSK